uniref:Uncharacterized protein n=1 Tax=Rhizophora mucronata TaxID=61149 RepID=A0A2P2QI84_RHIMU
MAKEMAIPYPWSVAFHADLS